MSGTIHLHSGNIIIDPANEQFARTITIFNGLVWEVDKDPPSSATMIDLQGQTSVPGLIDSHIHLLLGINGVGEVDLSECSCREEFESSMHGAAKTLEDNEWIIASGWSEETLGDYPSIDWLDCVGDIPSLCWRTDLHSALVNKALLAKLNIEQLSNMVGGELSNDGIIKETALWEGVCPFIPEATYEQTRHRLHKCVRALHANGITMVGTMEHAQDIDEFLWSVRHELGLRIRAMLLDDPTPELFEYWGSSNSDPFLSVTGFKTFIDGSLGSRTAKMYEPYCNSNNSGMLVAHAAEGELDNWVQKVSGAGFSPVMHAIGDKAVGLALASLRGVGTNSISRIEHAQFISEKDLQGIEGLLFGVQPLHKKTDDAIALHEVGKNRTKLLHNWRRMLDFGAKLSFGSDWPVAPHLPLEAMAIAIKSGLTPIEALIATTTDSAASLSEPLAGKLTLGCFGDITVLNCNPLDCDWQCQTPSVTMTIVSGEIKYRQEHIYA